MLLLNHISVAFRFIWSILVYCCQLQSNLFTSIYLVHFGLGLRPYIDSFCKLHFKIWAKKNEILFYLGNILYKQNRH